MGHRPSWDIAGNGLNDVPSQGLPQFCVAVAREKMPQVFAGRTLREIVPK